MLYLKNASETSAITIRYGVGSRKLIQVNPGCQIQKPFDLTSGEVQKYLGIFKDLSVIDIPENEVINDDNEENGENNDSENSINNSNDSDSDDESKQQNKEVQGNSNESNNNEEVGGSDGSSEETKSNDEQSNGEEQSSSEEQNGSTDSGHVCEGNCNGEQCQCNGKEFYTENQLKKMNIQELKKLLVDLYGMNLTESDTKKDYIAVILKQQEELQK